MSLGRGLRQKYYENKSEAGPGEAIYVEKKKKKNRKEKIRQRTRSCFLDQNLKFVTILIRTLSSNEIKNY